MVNNVKLGKNMRSVSIVGVGATPFFNGVENKTSQGRTNGELFGHAALDAMKWNEIVGSVAGDDTIICVIRSVDEAIAVMDKISKIIS